MKRLPLPFALYFYLTLLLRYCADCEEPPCFMVSSSNCAELKSEVKCGVSGDQFSEQIYCCNVTHERELINYFNTLPSLERILGFHMRDSSLEKLEITIFDKLKKLASFSITDSNITHINGAFDGHGSLTCLNVSQNMILEMYPYVLLKLKGLKNIVITNNTNISVLPEFSKELKGFKLDVSGNDQLSCKYLINLTLADAQQTMTFRHINRNSTICAPPLGKVFDDKTVYVKMEHLDKVKEIFYDCPTINNTDKCQCSVYGLDVGDKKGDLIYKALVNCSHKSMTSLPDKLPSATRILDISHNNITSLDGIGSQRFNNILEFYADSNRITSMKPLEGTRFFYQFQNLTLRNNKIDQISTYMLSNAFDRLQGTRILLGNNEIKCDCPTASHFKGWLLINTEHIPDYQEIYTVCESNRMKVVDMKPKDWCSKPTDWKDFIRFVICGEIIIFVFLIAKVSYDYYIFKTFGYLPWPASRMPKLPCDWCFET